MKFTLGDKRTKESFSVIYQEEEYSFDVVPAQESGYVSIMINNINLEINDRGEVLYLWGLCPLLNCKETYRQPQNFHRHKLKVSLGKELIPGISYRLNSSNEWPICVNKKSNWICIGDSYLEGKEMIEFAPNCVASLEEGNLKAIWVHLEKLPELNFRSRKNL